ncbi:MAG: IS200/IS605 family transposase [Nostoc sp. TH1S01]|nr:IS200/IS605 family transposase [Nostoc sp. TH1S01]
MHRNFTQLYAHCVWGTWDRLPLVTPDIQEIIYSAIAKQSSELGCKVIAIGGIVDHVYLLVGYPPNLTISELMQKTKGTSSHLITHEIKPQEFLKWQGGYGAFTVSHNHIEQIALSLRRQASF